MADPLDHYDVMVNLQTGDNGDFAKYLKTLSEQINKLTPETNKWGTAFAGVLGGAKDFVDKLKSGVVVVDTFKAAFNGFNDILKNMEAISVSAGMTSEQFNKLTDGIEMGAAATGKSFGAVAESARAIFEQTGLKDGLGQVVLDSERMSKIFGISETTIGKLTAQMIQFSEGTMTADDVMHSFDKTTGITGSKLEEMVEHITDMGKTMRNIVGGGDKFSKAMKAINESTTLVAAKFQEMGGDTKAFEDIQHAILDPNKWGEIATKLPGMAGNLMAMQEAMTSGDNDKFYRLLKEGAQRTVAMGAGMNAFTRSAAGFDMRTAEIFSKMDFNSLRSAGEAAGSVMDRMWKQLRPLGEQMAIFFNNFVAALMPVLGKLMEWASEGLSIVNSFFSSIQGFWTSTLAWLTMAGAAFWIYWKMTRKAIVKDVADTAEEVGKGAGKAVTGFTDTIAASATNMLKASLALLALGGALALIAGSIWIVSDALGKNPGAVIGGIAVLTLGILGMIAVISSLGPLAPAVLPGVAVLYILGFAVMFVAGAFWVFSKGVENIVNSVVKLADASDALGQLGETVKKLASMDFGMLDVAGTALGKFFKNLFSFSGGKEALDSKVVESVKGVISIIDSVSGSIVHILNTGMLLNAHEAEFNGVFTKLFGIDGGADGILITAIKTIASKLQHWSGDTAISEKVRTSITFLIDTMSKFSDGFIKMISLGQILTKHGKATIFIDKAISSVFGPQGFLKKMAAGASGIKDLDSVKKATDTITSMGAMTDSLVHMMSMGSIMDKHGTRPLEIFAGALRMFVTSLNDTGGLINKDSFDKLTNLTTLTDKLNNSFSHTIAISARGGAEVALEDHDKITREHQQSVEKLLTEIRDGVKAFGGSTTSQNAITKGNEPAWHPESMFSEVSEVF